jgi:outer membrane protein OmpA-like peptidoglycan-associated protein
MKASSPADGARGLQEVVVELSRNRARLVAETVIARYQLDAKRISVVGLGWDRPLDPKAPNDHAKNRRVELVIHKARN